MADDDHRQVCLRCRRPVATCFCHALTAIPSRTRVLFLQHPREARVPVSTCRMAHLSLPNSELHIGLRAVGNPALEAHCARPGAAVLFPSESATEVEDLEVPPEVLLVVDGTWVNAKKVVERCPVLSRLPRLKFLPSQPGNYRIRREPSAECLSTIEATAYVLERLEGAPGRFAPMLEAFDTMVEQQLGFARDNQSPSRHLSRRRRLRTYTPANGVLQNRELVAIFGEANTWPMTELGRPQPDVAELLHLVAERVSTGERFNRLLAPERPLGPRVPQHLGLTALEIEAGAPRAEVLAAWHAFVRPGDVQVGWGRYCRDLLDREGAVPAEFVNLRNVVTRLVDGRPGSVEALAERLGSVLDPGEGRGRALRRLGSLAFVTRAAMAGLEGHARPKPRR